MLLGQEVRAQGPLSSAFSDLNQQLPPLMPPLSCDEGCHEARVVKKAAERVGIRLPDQLCDFGQLCFLSLDFLNYEIGIVKKTAHLTRRPAECMQGL